MVYFRLFMAQSKRTLFLVLKRRVLRSNSYLLKSPIISQYPGYSVLFYVFWALGLFLLKKASSVYFLQGQAVPGRLFVIFGGGGILLCIIYKIRKCIIKVKLIQQFIKKNKSMKCIECFRVTQFGRYCCEPSLTFCLPCSQRICKKCHKKRYNVKHVEKNESAEKMVSKYCRECKRSESSLHQQLFYDKKCRNFSCHVCIYRFYEVYYNMIQKAGIPEEDQNQVKVQLKCQCQFLRSDIIQFLSKYCLHCSKLSLKDFYILKNNCVLHQSCYGKIGELYKQKTKRNMKYNADQDEDIKRFQYFDKLINFCSGCYSIIDGNFIKIAQKIDGLNICNHCLTKNQQLFTKQQKKSSFLESSEQKNKRQNVQNANKFSIKDSKVNNIKDSKIHEQNIEYQSKKSQQKWNKIQNIQRFSIIQQEAMQKIQPPHESIKFHKLPQPKMNKQPDQIKNKPNKQQKTEQNFQSAKILQGIGEDKFEYVYNSDKSILNSDFGSPQVHSLKLSINRERQQKCGLCSIIVNIQEIIRTKQKQDTKIKGKYNVQIMDQRDKEKQGKSYCKSCYFDQVKKIKMQNKMQRMKIQQRQQSQRKRFKLKKYEDKDQYAKNEQPQYEIKEQGIRSPQREQFVEQTMLKCQKCNFYKHLADFNRNKNICRDCSLDQQDKYFKKKQEDQRKKNIVKFICQKCKKASQMKKEQMGKNSKMCKECTLSIYGR